MKKTTLSLLVLILFSVAVFSQESVSKEVPYVPVGWWQIPQTPVIFTLEGYVKTDMIHDFDAVGSPNFIDEKSYYLWFIQ